MVALVRENNVQLLLYSPDIHVSYSIYRRSGFDYEILQIASFSEARNQRNRKVSLSILLSYGTGSTIVIIRITIWLDKPNLQSLNYAIKTHPTVFTNFQVSETFSQGSGSYCS